MLDHSGLPQPTTGVASPPEYPPITFDEPIVEPRRLFAADPYDVVGNNAYFNNLFSKVVNTTVTVADPLLVNVISPPSNILSIYNGSEPQTLILYESFTSPTDWTALTFDAMADGFPGEYGMNGFVISTKYQGASGRIRDLSLLGGDNLILGTSSGAYWRVENNSGDFIPTNASSADVGSPTSAVLLVHAMGISLQTYPSAIYGSLVADPVDVLGAILTMKQCTGIPVTNPGAGQAKLYFVAGTTGGTLKLVVKAGAAGTQTTILDNIPQ